jgi:hypothetical protein
MQGGKGVLPYVSVASYQPCIQQCGSDLSNDYGFAHMQPCGVKYVSPSRDFLLMTPQSLHNSISSGYEANDSVG